MTLVEVAWGTAGARGSGVNERSWGSGRAGSTQSRRLPAQRLGGPRRTPSRCHVPEGQHQKLSWFYGEPLIPRPIIVCPAKKIRELLPEATAQSQVLPQRPSGSNEAFEMKRSRSPRTHARAQPRLPPISPGKRLPLRSVTPAASPPLDLWPSLLLRHLARSPLPPGSFPGLAACRGCLCSVASIAACVRNTPRSPRSSGLGGGKDRPCCAHFSLFSHGPRCWRPSRPGAVLDRQGDSLSWAVRRKNPCGSHRGTAWGTPDRCPCCQA